MNNREDIQIRIFRTIWYVKKGGLDLFIILDGSISKLSTHHLSKAYLLYRLDSALKRFIKFPLNADVSKELQLAHHFDSC